MTDTLKIAKKSAPFNTGHTDVVGARTIDTTVQLKGRPKDSFIPAQPRDGSTITTTGGK